jgi:surface antigen
MPTSFAMSCLLSDRVRRFCLLVVAFVAIFCFAALPTHARAGTLQQAPLTQYNSTPNCPVSASQTLCGPWNVPAAPTSAIDIISNAWGTLLFDYGQCVYWLAEKYPALPLDDPITDPLAGNWDGWTWAYHAFLEGYQISYTPQPGYIAVWTVTTAAQPAGHTAFVEAVNSNGSIVVSQMDGDSDFMPLQGTTEYLTSGALSQYRQQNGLMYIVAGDGDTGTPRSYVELPTPAAQKAKPKPKPKPKKPKKKAKKRKKRR